MMKYLARYDFYYFLITLASLFVMCTSSLFFACALIGVQPWNLF